MNKINSEVLKQYYRMCRKRGADEDTLYDRIKRLLKTYRGSGWSVQERPEIVEYGGGSICRMNPGILKAIDYLESFDPEQEEISFEDGIEPLYETRWINEMISITMEKVNGFPDLGELYRRILHYCYFSSIKYTEKELLELLGLERSVFYSRKKESIMTFAVAFWNIAVPKVRKLADDPEKDNYTIKEFYFAGATI